MRGVFPARAKLCARVDAALADAQLATMKAQVSAAADQQREVLNILATAMDASGKTSPSLELEDILSQITGVFGDAPYANNLLYLIANDLETQSLESKAAKSIVTPQPPVEIIH